MTVDEAIPVMEKFNRFRQMAKLHTVTVIHGKGTGALRQAVQTNLKRNQSR
jgi:DNA mismatch repair protein MutS2